MSFAANGPGEMTLGPDDRAAALAEVKALARIATGDDDALTAAFAETALGIAERFLGRVLIERETVETLDGGAMWRPLGAAPVRAIAAVAAVDATGAATPLAVDDYALDIDAEGTGWVRVAAGGRIAVTYRAGLVATWDALTTPVRQGVVLLAAHLLSEREATSPPPAAVTALWRPFRTMRLSREAAGC